MGNRGKEQLHSKTQDKELVSEQSGQVLYGMTHFTRFFLNPARPIPWPPASKRPQRPPDFRTCIRIQPLTLTPDISKNQCTHQRQHRGHAAGRVWEKPGRHHHSSTWKQRTAVRHTQATAVSQGLCAWPWPRGTPCSLLLGLWGAATLHIRI